MKFDLRETAKDHKIIVAHRGVAGGNIPCNTIPAYETALKQGADMIETDLNMTSDGKLIIFHPMMERRHLGEDVYVDKLPWERVQQLRYQNGDRTPPSSVSLPLMNCWRPLRAAAISISTSSGEIPPIFIKPSRPTAWLISAW